MKLELAVLPLEVWADVFEVPIITRQWLAELANNIQNRKFAEKLQKLLHECGKHSLRYLDISSRQSDASTQESKIESECRAILTVTPTANEWGYHSIGCLADFEICEFPETEMPENIKTFKFLSIRHLDDEVLGFLDKIKPLFNNVFLQMKPIKSTDVRIFLAHFLQTLESIRQIRCDNECVEYLEQHFPESLAQAKELHLCNSKSKRVSIPAYLNWLNAPQDFCEHGPRLLWAYADSKTIFAIVDAVQKQFLASSTSSSAFVIFLVFSNAEEQHRADELTIENAATKEQLTVSNAQFKIPKSGRDIHYAEVLRNPMGADAKMREWIEKRAYFEKIYDDDYEENATILIMNPTIGRITKKFCAVDHGEDELADYDDKDEAGPSIPAKKMRNE